MEALLPLALLACPIGMGLMMWFMAKGQKKEQSTEQRDSEPSRQGSLAEQASLAALQAEQARLGAEIERLERR